MELKEIDEILEAQFGKKTTIAIAEANNRFCIELLNSRVVDGKFNAKVEKPSLDALAITIMAVYNFPNKTLKELARKQPAIKKTLLYCIVKGGDNYNELHSLIKKLLKKHLNKELNVDKVITFLNLIKGLTYFKSREFMDYMNYPERYDEISSALHYLIDDSGDEKAALVIISATEEGLLKPTAPRQAFIDEFNLNKSGFNKYMTQYQSDKNGIPNEKMFTKKQITTSLRNIIKYKIEDGRIIFLDKSEESNLVSICVHLMRKLLWVLLPSKKTYDQELKALKELMGQKN